MAVLRPAESAVRRLIVIVAHGLKLNSLAKSAAALTSPLGEGARLCRAERGLPHLPLFDPLKSFDPDSLWTPNPPTNPIIVQKSTLWHDASTNSTPVDATHISAIASMPSCARSTTSTAGPPLEALGTEARCRAQGIQPTRLSPMRPGLPPAGGSGVLTSMKS